MSGTFLGFVLLALVLLDVAAWLGGVDSRDAPDGEEWERRRRWNGAWR